MLPDFYTLLGVPPGATQAEIKQAFRLLTRQHHPDVVRNDPDAGERFQKIYQAYKVLSSREDRAHYDEQRARAYYPGGISQALVRQPGTLAPWEKWEQTAHTAFVPPTLELTCTLSHSQVATMPTEQVIYLLTELTPAANGQPLLGLPLNLCLAVDRSSSMRGEKLGAVKSALRLLIDRLEPEDILSIVAFDNYPEVLVRAEPHQFTQVLSGAIDHLIERGGTEIGRGLATALDEVGRHSKRPMVSHLILLTDGQTYGDEARCLELAKQAREQGIAITTLGIGTEWNESLLDQIATISDGLSGYLETPEEISSGLEQRVSRLRNILATRVRLTLDMERNVRLRRVTRLIPDIAELLDATTPEQADALSGAVQLDLRQVATASSQGSALVLLWEVVLPANITGQYQLGRIDVRYDLPYAHLLDQFNNQWLTVEYVEPHVYTSIGTSERVKKMIEHLTAYRIQNRARELAQKGDHATAGKLLHTAALRLYDAEEEQLAKESMAQAKALAQQGTLSPSALLRLKYGTKTLGRR